MSYSLSNPTSALFTPLSSHVLFVQTPSLHPTPYHTHRRQQSALAALNGIRDVHSHTAFFLSLSDALTQADTKTLTDILCPMGPLPPTPRHTHLLTFWVTPRLTTVSPWSSKATALLRNACGVAGLTRIETGQAYRLTFDSEKTLSQAKQVLNTAIKTGTGWPTWLEAFFDPLIETVLTHPEQAKALFASPHSRPLMTIPLLEAGLPALEKANTDLGCALTTADMDYLLHAFTQLKRNPTDVEIMMFAQANSEHCRHKIFRSTWEIDGHTHEKTLFDAIKATFHAHPNGVRSAYHDNGAVLTGYTADRWDACPHTQVYQATPTPCPIVIKVETHNHPTAIAPWPGAATGTGGEIRDEAAVGQGGCSQAGLAGFMVSDLHLPTLPQPWETTIGKPPHMQSALDIMLAGPLGTAAFSNEFGRPQIAGFFRTLCTTQHGRTYGYHKPIMLAGGMGHLHPAHLKKKPLPIGAKIIVLGGPALLIGLGGGAASSVQAGQRHAALDFASVQRSHPQMQRCCQALIDACCALEEQTPILAIHDVGAGGLANAIPELLHDAGRGGEIALDAIPCADPSLSPMEIWCNESQERYVLAIDTANLPLFDAIAQREHCPYAVVGTVTAAPHLLLKAGNHHPDAPQPVQHPVDLPLSVLLETKQVWHKKIHTPSPLPPRICAPKPAPTFAWESEDTPIAQRLEAALLRVLQLPCVADKRFLITIGDRSVGGCVVRDPLVGPWQVPVADVAVTANDFTGLSGKAMAIGERTPVAMTHVQASVRLAIAEAITNLAAAPLACLQDVALSANWMAAAQDDKQAHALYEGVHTASQFCQALGICIPVGKDSLSMQTQWDTIQDIRKQVLSPLSLVVTAFAPIKNVTQTLTPYCPPSRDGILLYVDLSHEKKGLAGSALAQVYCASWTQPPGTPTAIPHPLSQAPDTGPATALIAFVDALHACREKGYIHAYHDCADGGLITTLCEILFASRIGLQVDIAPITPPSACMTTLFHEGPGVVLQIAQHTLQAVQNLFAQKQAPIPHRIGQLTPENETLVLQHGDTPLLALDRHYLQTYWSSTSQAIERQRDRPEYVKNAYDAYLGDRPGLQAIPTFSMTPAHTIKKTARPTLAILREQGTNGHREMAAAWDRAGFRCIDVTMQDIISGKNDLRDCQGLAACGGFSYGDVLGAGRGWASTVLYHPRARDVFSAFFSRSDTFTLGVCNGCQFLSHIATLIPGAQSCPAFLPNQSERYESRWVMTRIPDSPSILFQGMTGTCLPVIISHGEGQARFPQTASPLPCATHAAVQPALLYANDRGQPAQAYPDNPNGSDGSTAGVTTADGRVTLLMPHPERCFLEKQWHWQPCQDKTTTPCAPTPWLRLFENARFWCDNH